MGNLLEKVTVELISKGSEKVRLLEWLVDWERRGILERREPQQGSSHKFI